MLPEVWRADIRVCGRAQVNKLDWLVFNVALFCTMFAGVDVGLGISIGVSIFLALYKTAFPKTAVLGRLPETTVFRRAPSRAPATIQAELLAAHRWALPSVGLS